MRRVVLAAAAFVLVVCLAFVVFFIASDFVVEEQSYFESLSDFFFMMGTGNVRLFGLDPPALTDRRYDRVMWHARRTAHYEVDEAVFFELARWGSEVEPRLEEEIDLWKNEARVRAAATALARLGNPAALEALEKAVTIGNRWLVVKLLEELYRIGPDAAPALVDVYERYRASDDPPPYNLLECLGRAGGAGTEFLLDELANASNDDEIYSLQWALAYTRDPRAARALFELMHHRELHIRRRSRDSMSQSMGEVAIEPAIDFLEQETDDYLRSWVLQSIVATRRARSSIRAVDYLERIVTDPVVSWEANYALARIGTDRAVAILREHMRDRPPEWVIGNLEYSGPAGVRILEDYTHHHDDFVRRQALMKLEEMARFEAAPIYRAALSDSEPMNRRMAERLLFHSDTLLLGESFRQWMMELSGMSMGRIYGPGRRATRNALGVVRVMHWIGLGVSALAGFLLLIGSLRAFEPYKFALVLQFLLVAGIIGDFFLMQDARVYAWATASRLVLLLGLLFLRDDPLPGEVRGRVERFAVRTLLILVPTVVAFGVPSFTEALRSALRDFDFMKWVALLLAVLTVLLLEQAVLPWHLFRRVSRLERAMTFVLSTSVVMIFVAALWRLSPVEAGGDRWTMNFLFTLPLIASVIFHINSSRLFARTSEPPGLPPAPGRILAVRDRESVIVKLKPRRSWRGVPHLVLGALALWFVAAKLEVAQGGGPAMALLICTAIFGTVLGWLLLAIVSPSFTIQIRDGAARSGSSFLGGVVGRAQWYRRLRLPAFVGRLALNPSEKRWLGRALDTT